MKCIYCNSEENMTVSDIIPWAITGAKLQKQFVCKTHNGFTNDQFERKFISDVGFFRNQLGLTERYGDPVKYTADLIIDGHAIKNVSVSNKASIVAGKRLFSQVNNAGGKSVIGPTNKLQKINGATLDKIKPIDMSHVMVSKHLGSLEKIFISSEALHTVAKIGYEWHCYINNLEGYDDAKYKDIVDFLLNSDSVSMPVDLVVDAHIWNLMDHYSRMGSNMLYEYDDANGNTYVVFGLWNILIYRIRICNCNTSKLSNYSLHNMYLYHTDKSSQETAFGIVGYPSVYAEPPKIGFNRVIGILKNRILNLEDRSITSKYLNQNVQKIKNLLSAYETGNCTFEKLIDYEDNDRLLTLMVLENLWETRDEYNYSQSFDENIYQLLGSGKHFHITQEKKREALQRYAGADREGTFSDKLKQFIQFFDQIVSTCS